MHINNPDALKTWLTEVLEPLCDADPAALARYVLALLKKDKPEKDLRDCMKEQLDVFLGQETDPFLEQLFRAIKSEEYIKIVQAKEAAAAAAAAATAAAAAAIAAQQATAQASPATAAAAAATASTEQVSNSSHSNSTSSSKVRIKREFTPPLHESKPSKDSLASGVPSGATVSSSSSSHDNADLSSSASSGAISSSAATPSGNAAVTVSSSAAAAATSNNNNSSKSTPPVKSSSNKDDHSKESRSRGRRISNRSRSRSRSRSFERSRRSRSRDRGLARESNREKSNRQYRNKSPVGRGGGSDSFRRYERKNHGYDSNRNRGGNGGSGGGNVKSEGEKRGTIRSQSRSRSPSPLADRRKMARSESPAVAAPAIVPAPVLEHPPAGDGPMLGGKRQRCRDFDEKGYCMRGETCPWDHGVDPVVLEDINNPALITIQSAAQLRTGPIHPEYSPDAPELWNRPPNFPPGRPSITQRLGNMTGVNQFGPRGGLSGNFRNVAPGFPPGFPGNQIGATPLQRELISVPVVDANKGGDVSSQQTKRRFEPEDAVAIADGHLKRKLPLNNRLGPRVTGHPAGAGGAVNPQQNCSLELRKIPRGLNAIAHLNNHFSKFGKIVNIQISYDGDPEAAIVTFSTHAEANVAYRSTEAVLNNRFIKVFWHTAGNGEQPAITPAAKTEHSLRRSYPNQYSINNNLNQNTNVTTAGNTQTTGTPAVTKEGTPVSSSAAVSSGGENVAPVTTAVATGFTNTATKLINTVTTPIVTANQLRMKNSKINRATSELMRKKQELTQTMHKGKYDLMQGYLKELSKLIMMVEKYEATDPMRTQLLVPIKDLESKIASLRTEISSEQNQIVATLMPKRKTKEQHEKDILDAELEIIAAEQRTHRIPGVGGANPQPAGGLVLAAPLPGGKPQHPGQRPVRPTNRVAPIGSTSVDRRPTTISITGFAAEDADALLGHFKNFGEITKHQLDKTVPSLQISYSIRQNAEKALARGKAFRGDVTLTIGWVATVPVQPTIPNPVVAPVGAAESKDKSSSAEAVVEKDAAAKEGADASGKVTTLEVTGAVGGAGVGVDTSSAASLDTLTETGSMEEASEVRMVEEEEEEEEEDRSWRR